MNKNSAPSHGEVPDNLLDQSAAHRLLLLTNLLAKPFLADFEKEFDLSLNDWRVMLMLANRPGLSASEIGEQTGMHLMNVSRSVQRLTRLGRVRRQTDPADRRRQELMLTPRGLAVYHRIKPHAWQREWLVRSALDPDEMKEFLRLLDKVIADILVQGSNETI